VILTDRLRQALVSFHWPGNIRQLENVVRKLLVLRDPDTIAGEIQRMAETGGKSKPTGEGNGTFRTPEVDSAPTPDSVFEQVSQAKNEAEAEAILAALNWTRWNRKQAAARLNIDYKAFLYKMKKLSIEERASRFSN
jgi:two-component system response regulator AtoC